MLASELQRQANQENSQKSTGPKTEEGKAKASMNALKHGLRTCSLILPEESMDDYRQLWDEYEADWLPANKAEYAAFEDMVAARWLLARVDWSENRVTQTVEFGPQRFDYFLICDKRRTKFEKSYWLALENLERLQAKRKSQPEPKAEPKQKAKPAAEPPVKSPQPAPPPPPEYVMSDSRSEAVPIVCASETGDSRS